MKIKICMNSDYAQVECIVYEEPSRARKRLKVDTTTTTSTGLHLFW